MAKPTGVTAGDLLIAKCTSYDIGGQSVTSSGWTLLGEVAPGGTKSTSVHILYKVAGSSEPSSYTFTESTPHYVTIELTAWSGADTASAPTIGAFATGNALSGAGAKTFGGITMPAAGVLLACVSGYDNGWTAPGAPWSTLANNYDGVNSTYAKTVASGATGSVNVSTTGQTSYAGVLIGIAEAGGGTVTLAPANAAHGHTAATPALVQVHTLAPAGSVLGHTADVVELEQTVTLAPANAAHGHTATGVVLTQVHVLAPANAAHGHTAATPALAQVHVLAPASAAHGQSAAAVVLVQVHELVVDDAEHGQTSSTPSPVPAGSLAVDSAAHGHTAATPALTQAHVLAPAGSVLGHTADVVELEQTVTLAPANAAHGHTATGVVLTQVHVLAPAGSVLGHTASPVVLGTLALRAVVVLTARAMAPPTLSARVAVTVTITVREGDTPMSLRETFDVRQRPIITATFERDGERVDPPTVWFEVRAEGDLEPTRFVHGEAPEVTHPGPGVYDLALPPFTDEGARLYVRADAEGGGLDTGTEDWIRVRRSNVVNT